MLLCNLVSWLLLYIGHICIIHGRGIYCQDHFVKGVINNLVDGLGADTQIGDPIVYSNSA